MAHDRRLLDLGPHHDPRCVAKEQDGEVEGVAELQEARGLVGRGSVDRPGEVARVVRDDADRAALDASECGHHAATEAAPQFEHRSRVCERLDDGADLVDAQPVLRDRVAQRALVVLGPRRQISLEVGQVAPGDRDCLALVLDRDVHDPVGHLDRHRPDLLGPEDAEPATLDHRGAAHADIRISGRDDHVAAAEERRVAGETSAGVDADERHEPRETGEQMEGHAVEPGHTGHVGVAGASATALGEEDHRQAESAGEFE